MWKKANKKSSIVKENGSRKVIYENETRLDDGKLELLTYRKKAGLGSKIYRVSQSKYFVK